MINIPSIVGQYAYLDLKAKTNTAFNFGFDVEDSSGSAVNLNLYDAIRLRCDAGFELNTNTNTITVVNNASVLIDANASTMNVRVGYYGFDMQTLIGGEWETIVTGTFRIDPFYG